MTMGKGGRRGRLRYNEFTGWKPVPPQFLGFLPWRSSRLCERPSLFSCVRLPNACFQRRGDQWRVGSCELVLKRLPPKQRIRPGAQVRLSTGCRKYRDEPSALRHPASPNFERPGLLPGFSRQIPLATVFRRWCGKREPFPWEPALAGLLDQRIHPTIRHRTCIPEDSAQK